MGKAVFTPYQQNWRWYQNNAAEPTIALANQNTAPNLTDTNIIRLRVGIGESGGASGSGEVTLEYSTDDINFTAFGSGNHWNYANGLATEGNTITGNLLTTQDGQGLYHESGSISESIAANQTSKEMDFSIQQTGTALADTTYYFRTLLAGAVVNPVTVPRPSLKTVSSLPIGALSNATHFVIGNM